MENKIKVLCISPDGGGVSFYRCSRPHVKLDEILPDEFSVDIVPYVDWRDLDYISKYNIITFNKGDFPDWDKFKEAVPFCKERGIKIVLDLDDYWVLEKDHPLHAIYQYGGVKERVIENLRIADCVTTTTEHFANIIRKYNKNVYVLPNAVDPNDKQFKPNFDKYDPEKRLRIGFIMGSTHLKDMELIDGIARSLYPGLLDRVQFVLCGFDLRGTVTQIDPNTGEHTVRDIKPTETTWFSYENMLTDGYRLISPEYRAHLLNFTPNLQYKGVENEIYRREWTKDINSYATHYDNIDVLFVPLVDNEFNCCKSELKLIEAGFKNKPIVMSDVGPYKIGTRSIFKKGGEIDPDGNCILVDPIKRVKGWAKVVKRLVEHPEYMDIMRDNLRKYVVDEYSLEKVTRKRADLYKDLLK